MITVEQAHQLITETTRCFDATVSVSLRQLRGRVLAEDVRAGFAMPRFTNAASTGHGNLGGPIFLIRFSNFTSPSIETELTEV